MAAGTLSAMNTGANIVVGGLVVQLLFFGFFVIISAVFHWRVKKQPQYVHVSSVRSHSPETRTTWEAIMWALYVACCLILVRSVFRVVEFVEGNNGFIMRREYLLYIFDACLMSLTGVVLIISTPVLFCPEAVTRGTVSFNSSPRRKHLLIQKRSLRAEDSEKLNLHFSSYYLSGFSPHFTTHKYSSPHKLSMYRDFKFRIDSEGSWVITPARKL